MMAAAYVEGLQAQGVAATIKHFVGNDQEHERTAAESVMSERALREIYLYPYVPPFSSCEVKTSSDAHESIPRFMLAQRKAQPWAFMTSLVGFLPVDTNISTQNTGRYGRINGVHCAENPTLLQNILRKEWGFDGIVISDWYLF